MRFIGRRDFSYTLYHLWYRYIRAYYLKEKIPGEFEIKLPKIISKSPKAMEVALGIFIKVLKAHGSRGLPKALCARGFAGANF